jgi:transposase
MRLLNKQILAAARVFSVKKAVLAYRSLSAKERKRPEHKKAKAVALETVRNAEWLVITDPQLLSPGRQERLRQLRENNQLFADLYAFTAKLKAVWTACTEQSALHMLNECIELCEAIADDHGFDDIRKFGKLLSRRADGIAAACVVRFGTNMLEGANNTAKVIKRVAYGFRDFEYFALKLMGPELPIK